MAILHGLCVLNAYLVLPGAEHFYARMAEEFSFLGVSFEKTTNAQILSYLDSNGNVVGKPLNADFILYLDKDLYASYALEARGYRLFNSAKAIELCDDKMRTHLALANQGIKMPKTIAGPLDYSTEPVSLEFIHNLEKELSFPLVAKQNFGSLGKNVYLLHNENELLGFEEAHKYEPRLYQEYIASSKGVDYRIILVGGKFLTGMKRVNDAGDFRSNIALGGHGEAVVIPPAYIAIAEKAAQILHLDYGGADVMIGSNGEPVLCEVNSNAFIGGIEPTTGVNVAKAYASYIVKALNR
jgi:gamma-F420-2:alpha-L-glutamate ligase